MTAWIVMHGDIMVSAHTRRQQCGALLAHDACTEPTKQSNGSAVATILDAIKLADQHAPAVTERLARVAPESTAEVLRPRSWNTPCWKQIPLMQLKGAARPGKQHAAHGTGGPHRPKN